MKPDKQHLLDDLLETGPGAVRRELVLATGASVLRRRRSWRVIRQSSFLALAAACIFLLGIQLHDKPRPGTTSVAAPPGTAAAGIQVHVLSDDELLSLFPEIPVGLVTSADGKKRLIFPRPGDEARFVTRL